MSTGTARRWRSTILAAVVLAGLLEGAAVRAANRPSVASINLCTDQLVLALADPEQVLGLSPYARDPDRSWAAARAAAYPVLSGSAEDVLALRPDLVLAGRYTKRTTRELLKQQGLRVVEFGPARSIAEALAQMREVGALLGHPDRAEREVAAVEQAVARARAVPANRTLSVLPLLRRGWVSGRDTLLASFLAAIGLRNAGDRLARPAGGQVALETIVAAHPDRLLVAAADGGSEDQGSAFLHHSTLEALYPAQKRLVLPETLTSCGGPMIPEALQRLSEGVRRSLDATR